MREPLLLLLIRTGKGEGRAPLPDKLDSGQRVLALAKKSHTNSRPRSHLHRSSSTRILGNRAGTQTELSSSLSNGCDVGSFSRLRMRNKVLNLRCHEEIS